MSDGSTDRDRKRTRAVFPIATGFDSEVQPLKQDLGPEDKENEPPESKRMRRALAQLSPMRQERTSVAQTLEQSSSGKSDLHGEVGKLKRDMGTVQSANARLLGDIAVLNNKLDSLTNEVAGLTNEVDGLSAKNYPLETSWLVLGGSTKIVGHSQFRDDFMKAIRRVPHKICMNARGEWYDSYGQKYKESEVEAEANPVVSGGPSRVTGANEEVFSDGQTLDTWANNFNKGSWKQCLDRRELRELNGFMGLVKKRDLRDARNEETHQIGFRTFAYTVVTGADEGDETCFELYSFYGKAFEFTYGMSWDDAADEAKKKHDRD